MRVQQRQPSPDEAGQPGTFTLVSQSPEETHHLGARLGAVLRGGELVLLEGDLGAGKTAFTQGIAAGLQVPQVVSSPTFTLLKEYIGRLPLYHFDLYRLDDPLEIVDLGFEEYFSGAGVCVVEWANKADALWPAEHLRVRFAVLGETTRELVCSAVGAQMVDVGEAFRKSVSGAGA